MFGDNKDLDLFLLWTLFQISLLDQEKFFEIEILWINIVIHYFWAKENTIQDWKLFSLTPTNDTLRNAP